MMGQTPGWWFETNGLLACAPPKCGLMSFLAALVPGLAEVLESSLVDVGEVAVAYAQAKGRGPFSAAAVVSQFPDKRRLLSVRDPVRRFRSLWRDKCQPSLADDPVFGPLSPDELMDLIESYPFGDAHWMPQWAYLVPNVELVPIERFNARCGLKSVHTHRSEDINAVMPADRILAHYERDDELWKRAHG